MENEVDKMKYHLTTFGCQANERDSELISGLLKNLGYEATADIKEADLILFNTCCVREKAENKVLSRIGELKELKSQKPNMIIGVSGCMVQQEKMPEKIRQKAPHVDLIFGTHNLHELPELINNIHLLNQPQVSVRGDREEIVENLPSQRNYPFKALVNITYGCNNFCTYCIVPYVRGREKSRKPEHILKEVRQMTEEGVKEVMLLGQNVNSYGKDLVPIVSFSTLLQEVNNIEGLKRIRYMTSHPRDFVDELIETLLHTEKVCPHFHLPVQAGSDRILKAMNRGYTRTDYLQLIDKIRISFPRASITTDIIVGFPGESEEDFADTLDLLERVRFDSAFTFIYSPRSGTPAAKMSGHISQEIKKKRLQELMVVQNRISLEINSELTGQVLEVLVEGESKSSGEMYTGRTDTNKTVIFPGSADLIGNLVKVSITSPQTWILRGELINTEH